ncbi:hypothetical protein [Clostridium saccharoperbutylacetonicum]|uniref:hypothetical protein n=1 Tax=Clostridium saccharoperbutylacetonicum TaxID=36745 RepID=UPI0039E74AEB
MDVVNVTNESIEIFSKVLNDSAEWLNSINQPMWKCEDTTSEQLLVKVKLWNI